jgi:hypothetical protein
MKEDNRIEITEHYIFVDGEKWAMKEAYGKKLKLRLAGTKGIFTIIDDNEKKIKEFVIKRLLCTN